MTKNKFKPKFKMHSKIEDLALKINPANSDARKVFLMEPDGRGIDDSKNSD